MSGTYGPAGARVFVLAMTFALVPGAVLAPGMKSRSALHTPVVSAMAPRAQLATAVDVAVKASVALTVFFGAANGRR